MTSSEAREFKKKLIGVTPQELYLELIELSSFNGFDGKKVVEDLRKHEDLWVATLITRDGGMGITLRDLNVGENNVDTLYILVSNTNLEKMLELAQKWKPDEISTMATNEAVQFLGTYSLRGGSVIRLWWD